MTILENIDIDIDKAVLENIDIDKDTFENIDIDINEDILENIDIIWWFQKILILISISIGSRDILSENFIFSAKI